MGRDILIKWLKNAHTMEQAVIKNLEKHSKDADGHPQIQSRINQHIVESKRHAQMVKDMLKQFDEKPSGVKEMMGSLMGTIQGSIGGPEEEKLVKDSATDYAAEHFEIASYRAIQRAAELNGHMEIVSLCEQIIQDEKNMAQFLEENLPATVELYVQTGTQQAAQREPAFHERIDGEKK